MSSSNYTSHGSSSPLHASSGRNSRSSSNSNSISNSNRQEMWSDRRQMIGYEEQPFDCHDVDPTGQSVSNGVGNNDDNDNDRYSRYSRHSHAPSSSSFSTPTKKAPPSSDYSNNNIISTTTTTTTASATTTTTTPSPRRTSSSKSRPWRVDVMLKKNKGVERSTVSWKQQMRERKQVFQVSGVTVLEEDNSHYNTSDYNDYNNNKKIAADDDVFANLEGEEDDDVDDDDDDNLSRGSERATIGIPSSSQRQEIIDLTSVGEDSMDKQESFLANPTYIQDLKTLGSMDEDEDEHDHKHHHETNLQSNSHQSRKVNADGSNNDGISKQVEKQVQNVRQRKNPATSICEDLQTAMNTLENSSRGQNNENNNDNGNDNDNNNGVVATQSMEQQEPSRSLLPSPLATPDLSFDKDTVEDGNDQQEQEQQLYLEPVITDLTAALDQYALPSVKRTYTDDSDDGMSVGSVRSIASSHYNGTAQKQEVVHDHHKRTLLQSLEMSFTPRDEESYTITALGRADPNAKPAPPKNEYFIAYARFQRSRFVKELNTAVQIVPTHHFEIVEKTYQDWKAIQEEKEARYDYANRGNAERLLNALSFEASSDDAAGPVATVAAAAVMDDENHGSTSPSIADTSPSVSSPPPTESNDSTVPILRKCNDDIVVETVFSDSAQSTPVASPIKASTLPPLSQESTMVVSTASALSPETEPIVVETVFSDSAQSTPATSPVKKSIPSGPSQHTSTTTKATTSDSATTTFALKHISIVDNINVLHPSTESQTVSSQVSPDTALVLEQSTGSVDSTQAKETILLQKSTTQLPEQSTTTSTTNTFNNVDSTPPMDSSAGSMHALEAPKTDLPDISSNLTNLEDQAQSVDVQSSQAADKVSSMSNDQVVPSSPPTVAVAVAPVQPLPKKSKASKWKDRLAKRKSISKKDSESTAETQVVTVSVNDEAKDDTILISNEVERNTTPTQEMASPSGSEKGRRKSNKWKQRLADKKKKNNANSLPDALPINENKESVEETVTKQEATNDVHVSIESKSDMSEPITATSEKTASIEKSFVPSSTNAPLTNDSALTCEDEKKEDDIKLKQREDAIHDTILEKKEMEQHGNLQNDLQNSFFAFDSLLQQRGSNGDLAQNDEDDFSEYTIEESVLHSANRKPTTATAAKSLLKGEVSPRKSADYESEYEEITVDQSFMELTVDDSRAFDDEFAAPGLNDSSNMITPVHAATTQMINSRMFSTPQVAEEPTITIQTQQDDDEMTQLTFDQSHAPGKTAQLASHAPIPTSIGKEVVQKRNSTSSSAKGSVKDGLVRSNSGSMRSRSKRGSTHSHRSSGSRGGKSTASDRNSKRVAELLRKDIWSRDGKVVQEAMESIVTEASKGAKYRLKITQCGGIMGIVRAMETHASVEIVQVAGCNALQRMALDANTQVIIGEMGGITTILEAMKSFSSNGDIQKAGCSALSTITRHRGTTDEAEGAVPVLCAAMTRHSANMHVQSKAFGAIANLCMDNQDRLKELSDAGGMLAMTMALQQPWPSKREKHEAISNLSILLRCLAEHEEGDHDEEDEDEYNEHDDEISDLMSVVSQLEEEMSLQPDDEEEEDEFGFEEYNEASLEKYQEGKEISNTPVESLQKIPPTQQNATPRKSEQGSNSTQPTVTNGKEIDDENCIIM